MGKSRGRAHFNLIEATPFFFACVFPCCRTTSSRSCHNSGPHPLRTCLLRFRPEEASLAAAADSFAPTPSLPDTVPGFAGHWTSASGPTGGGLNLIVYAGHVPVCFGFGQRRPPLRRQRILLLRLRLCQMRYPVSQDTGLSPAAQLEVALTSSFTQGMYLSSSTCQESSASQCDARPAAPLENFSLGLGFCISPLLRSCSFTAYGVFAGPGPPPFSLSHGCVQAAAPDFHWISGQLQKLARLRVRSGFRFLVFATDSKPTGPFRQQTKKSASVFCRVPD